MVYHILEYSSSAKGPFCHVQYIYTLAILCVQRERERERDEQTNRQADEERETDRLTCIYRPVCMNGWMYISVCVYMHIQCRPGMWLYNPILHDIPHVA